MTDHIHDHCDHPACGDGLFCCRCVRDVLALTEQRLRDLVALVEDSETITFEGILRYAVNASEFDAWKAAFDIAREHCQRDLIGNDCRCVACEMRRVEAAEAAQEASEGR